MRGVILSVLIHSCLLCPVGAILFLTRDLKVCPLESSVCAEGCPKSQGGLQDPRGRLSGLT